MKAKVEWVPLRIADAAAVVESGMIATNEKAARDVIRNWIRPADKPVATLAGRKEGANEIQCVAQITRIDVQSRRGMIRWMEDANPDAGLLMDLLRELIDFAFFHLDLHRLEFPVETGETHLATAASALGMWQEGRLRHALYEEPLHTDALSYVLLRPQFRFRGYGFVPFAKGVLAIHGREDQIDVITFLRRGEVPIDPYLRECAAYRGWLDEKGRITERVNTQIASQADSPLPSEVVRACGQMEEYFEHRRTTFDLRLELPDEASAFQRRVWRILSEIDYGHVWTYEDVAISLMGGSREEGRRMTRAVGSACATNPLAIVIPCHRVIGKSGKLTGFAGGVDVKEYLLAHEWIVPETDPKEASPEDE